MRRYETIVITHVDLSEDELSTLITRYGNIVTGQKGVLIKVERWGKRKLAYLIGKQARGFYLLFDYAGVTAVVTELERNLKIDDKILKFMTILKAEAVDPDALAKEMAGETGEEKTEAPAPPLVVTSATGAGVTDASGVADKTATVPDETNAKGEMKS